MRAETERRQLVEQESAVMRRRIEELEKSTEAARQGS